jgi:hypothetical protein
VDCGRCQDFRGSTRDPSAIAPTRRLSPRDAIQARNCKLFFGRALFDLGQDQAPWPGLDPSFDHASSLVGFDEDRGSGALGLCLVKTTASFTFSLQIIVKIKPSAVSIMGARVAGWSKAVSYGSYGYDSPSYCAFVMVEVLGCH